MFNARIGGNYVGEKTRALLSWMGRSGGAVVALALLMASASSHAVFIETFEDESNGSTTFSEPGGPVFTSDSDLLVEFFAGLGSGGSNLWLGTGFVGAGNGSGGSSGNVGAMTVAAGWSFVVNSFDAWTGQQDGNQFFAGDIKFIGTKTDNSIVEATLNIPTPNNTDFVTGLTFGGTALDGMSLTSLSFELVTGAPLDYLAIDNINYDAAQLPGGPGPGPVPEPSSLLLLALGLLVAGRSLRLRS